MLIRTLAATLSAHTIESVLTRSSKVISTLDRVSSPEHSVSIRPARWLRRTIGTVAVLLTLIGGLTLLNTSGVAAVTPSRTPVVASADEPENGGMTPAKAVVLGVIEGVTEYLPVSSTGHLLVAERLLDVGQTDASKEAVDAYTAIIQAGAILAVVGLFWKRIQAMLLGLVGRDHEGRSLLIALVVAFVPAAVIGKGGESIISDELLYVGPVVAAWIVGGLFILWFVRQQRTDGRALEQLTWQHAGIIGLAQTLALWPGVSRSLVTLVAAVLLGYSLAAAVEFAFLLGVVTLTAAAGYKALTDGSAVIDTFGASNVIIGIVVAALSAVVAVKWMVGWLKARPLTVFGWYRIGAGVVTLALLAAGAI
jgi:undecaprenyl-diphosphatase